MYEDGRIKKKNLFPKKSKIVCIFILIKAHNCRKNERIINFDAFDMKTKLEICTESEALDYRQLWQRFAMLFLRVNKIIIQFLWEKHFSMLFL